MSPKRENMSKAGKKIMAKREADFAQSQTSPSEDAVETDEMRAAVEKSRNVGCIHTIMDEFGDVPRVFESTPSATPSPRYDENEKRQVPVREIAQELDVDYNAGTPYVPRIDLDDFVAGEPLKPGPLTMEVAYELGKLTVENFAPPTGQPKTDNPALHVSMAQDSEGKFPKFVNPPEGRDRDELISALKKSMLTLEEANEECRKLGLFDTHEEDPTEVAFNEADPNAEHGIAYWMEKETSDGETPDMAQVHEGAAQGGGAEAGLGDEECSSDGSGDCQDDAEQVG